MSILAESYIRFGLSIIIAIVLLGILLRFRAKRNPKKSSLDILKERLEKGEITEQEYEEARKKQEIEH
ncbi:SHOCT domain-containing protein [Virgibacillus byunsanensis]|uniref:SHOCT domain-containing protein n=1 Tax=Virgibacillus byunsanensis TaxID=570945 RepID=A0ABW3LJY9_9BACI